VIFGQLWTYNSWRRLRTKNQSEEGQHADPSEDRIGTEKRKQEIELFRVVIVFNECLILLLHELSSGKEDSRVLNNPVSEYYREEVYQIIRDV